MIASSMKLLCALALLVGCASGLLRGELAGDELADGFQRFDEDKWTMRDESQRTDAEYERFFLMSLNRPSKVSFKPSKPGAMDSDIIATIERLNNDGGKGAACSLPVFSDRRASYFVKLRSMLANELEIFSVIKAFPDMKDNAMDIFLVNMRDCKWTKTEMMKGFDFENKKIFMSLKECRSNKNLEIFSANGEKDCGAKVCKWMFNMESLMMSEPMKFMMLDNKPEWWMQFIAPSDKDGYFAIIQKDKKMQMLSLNNNGMILNSWDEELESWRQALRVSTMNGAFSFCMKDMKMKNMIKCTMLDKEMKLKSKKMVSLESEPKMMGLRNLPEWGMMLLTVQCAEEDQWRCKGAQIGLEKIWPERSDKMPMLKEDACWLKKRQKIGFFLDDAKNNCIFYECDMKMDKAWDKNIKTKCF